MMEKRNLMGMNLAELQEFVESLGEKRYRAQQLFSWIYGKQARTFEEMTDVSRGFRELLAGSAVIGTLRPAAQNASQRDAAVKFLFQLEDGLAVESVLIPPDPASPAAERRLTLCISTQVGCPLDCKFCATGTMGFTRNLTAGEIVEQVIQAQRLSGKRITNIVYMGMGEPMLNYENVMKSIALITADESLNIGTRHITVSTAGYADGIRRMADEGKKVKLALSLHSLDPEKRTALMPITKKFGIDALIAALEYYYRETGLRPTMEYIVFEGFNDGPDDVRRLAKLSGRVPLKINLIPYHSIAFTGAGGLAAELHPASAARREEFAAALRKQNLTVMIRTSSGEDINAACGQLAVRESARRAQVS